MTQAVLLDLGNVVLGIDFRRVFAAWAQDAGIDVAHFHTHWRLDDAYKAHEVGAISFADYCDNLATMFNIELTEAQWRDGWNALWTSPFQQVIELLPEIKARYALYAFTNTNDTHADCWRSLYARELTQFEHIFVSSEIGVRKPEVEAFQEVCSRMRSDPQEVLFLDDTEENVVGARRSGLRALHVAGEHDVAAALRDLL